VKHVVRGNREALKVRSYCTVLYCILSCTLLSCSALYFIVCIFAVLYSHYCTAPYLYCTIPYCAMLWGGCRS